MISQKGLKSPLYLRLKWHPMGGTLPAHFLLQILANSLGRRACFASLFENYLIGDIAHLKVNEARISGIKNRNIKSATVIP